MNKKIKVCFFGLYDPLYNRHKVILEGFKAKKMDFYECSLNKNYGSYLNNFLFGNLRLIKKYLKTKKDFTHIIIWGDIAGAYSGWLLSKLGRKILIFDPITSIYSTMVEEKKLTSSSSFKAKLFFIYEKLAYKLPDFLLSTTEEFKQHFCELYSIKPERILVLPVGGIVKKTNRDSTRKKSKVFTVLYWGGFHPQHGIESIIRAAKLVEEYNKKVSFKLIGKGHCWNQSINLSKKLGVSNVTFPGYSPAKNLREEIIHSDIVLGFFGTSERADRSIGNKVFEALAYGKPVITEKSQAICRLFRHKKELYMVTPGNPREISEGIIELYENPDLREKISICAYKRLKKNFSEKKTAEKLINMINTL